MRASTSVLLGVGLGAGLMYLFGPGKGTARGAAHRDDANRQAGRRMGRRLAACCTGGALAATGLQARTPLGAALGLGGAGLLLRAITPLRFDFSDRVREAHSGGRGADRPRARTVREASRPAQKAPRTRAAGQEQKRARRPSKPRSRQKAQPDAPVE